MIEQEKKSRNLYFLPSEASAYMKKIAQFHQYKPTYGCMAILNNSVIISALNHISDHLNTIQYVGLQEPLQLFQV